MIQELDHSIGTLTVSGIKGHRIVDSIDDVRSTIVYDDYASETVSSF